MPNQVENNTLTALKGVRVGHSTQSERLTGCTVVVFDKPYPVAYKAYGGAAGTFNTDLLRSGTSFYRRRALFVSGGSMTGLMSASEIMQAMIEEGADDSEAGVVVGDDDPGVINPSISGAVVFDLGMGIVQFDPSNGRKAYRSASSGPVPGGNIGAGTGTSVGSFQYLEQGTKYGNMKAGVGSSKVVLGGGVTVCALSVVNALGNVINRDGTILAGNRDERKDFKDFTDTTTFVTESNMNTTISIVGINVDLQSVEAYERVAHMATHGQVRTISPAHTSVDGDTVFVFSTEERQSVLNSNGQEFQTEAWPNFTLDIIGQAGADAVQESIYDACRSAETIRLAKGYQGVIPAAKDYPSHAGG